MIVKYIIAMLKTDDNVYVNDLGLFEKRLIPSEMKNGVITPPSFRLFFDANGDGNGFAFILKYAEREQKRLNDADEEIRNWVNDLKNAILNNKSVEIDGFGTFSKNNKGDIVFESAWIRELNIEFEGMDALKVEKGEIETEIRKQEVVEEIVIAEEKEEEREMPPVVEEIMENVEEEEREKEEEEVLLVAEEITENEKEKREDEEREVSPVVEEITKNVEEEREEKEEKEEKEEEDDTETENEEEKDDVKKKRRIWPWILLIIMLLLIPTGYFGYKNRVELELVYKEYKQKILKKKKNFYKRNASELLFILPENARPGCNQVDNLDVPFVWNRVTESEAESDTPVSTVDAQVIDEKENVSESITIDQTKAAPKQVNVVTAPSSTAYAKINYQKGNFYVIAGSFGNEKDAAQHIEDTNLANLTPYLLYQEGNNRVRVCIGVFSSVKEADAHAKSFDRSYWVLQ